MEGHFSNNNSLRSYMYRGILCTEPYKWSSLTNLRAVVGFVISVSLYTSPSIKSHGSLVVAMNKDVTKTESDDNTSLVEIKVLLFARARELAGVPDLTLKMPSGSTTQKCMDELVLKFPSLEQVRGFSVLALNEEYTTDTAIVQHKDELAIIPPISGG